MSLCPRWALVSTWLLCVLTVNACARPRSATAPRAAIVEAVRSESTPINQDETDYDLLLDLIGESRVVLLGESTHGTREFYRERARISRRLIEEKSFTVVAVEGDWADAYDVNEFIHGRGPALPELALSTFDRFPSWMWNNAEVAEFVRWLREHNAAARAEQPVGFYGLDLYNVIESAQDVIAFLERNDPAAAARTRSHYGCFDRLQHADLMAYGRRVVVGERRSCAEPAAAVFRELSARVAVEREGHRPGDEALISAWQNARVAMNGEAYYRSVYAGGAASWNLRDQHMADTLDALARHLDGGAPGPAKVVVWAHNSHLGDARMTARATEGEWNVGQLMRQRHGRESVLVGFTTYEGTVRAAATWGGGSRAYRLRPARADSVAALFHESGVPAFVLPLRGRTHLRTVLRGNRLQRFVGVVYAPATERNSHYFEADVANQYDAVVHIDRTTAVEPIAKPSGSPTRE